MFEKEGIRYALEETIDTECLSMPIEDFHFIDLSEEQQEKAQCWKDGAEFGYNKANEWHDLRKDPNDLPKEQINRFLFAYVKNYGGKKPMLVCYNGEWFYDANTYNNEVKVIQWCEIPQFKE